jgi:hypothetical protein
MTLIFLVREVRGLLRGVARTIGDTDEPILIGIHDQSLDKTLEVVFLGFYPLILLGHSGSSFRLADSVGPGSIYR